MLYKKIIYCNYTPLGFLPRSKANPDSPFLKTYICPTQIPTVLSPFWMLSPQLFPQWAPASGCFLEWTLGIGAKQMCCWALALPLFGWGPG